MKPIRPLLIGVEGHKLTADERAFFSEMPPFGFLLFARNIDTPEQTRDLCDELKEFCPFPVPLIAVDQEGGRVQRVKFGGKLPAAAVFGQWWTIDQDAALEGAYLDGFLLAAQLRSVGATWLLGPLVDVANDTTHAIIGDRSFSDDPAVVTALAGSYSKGVKAGGCLTCLKHAPGHGRSVADSHMELPVVNVSLRDLEIDYAPFKALAPHEDFLMTAHIRYSALDKELPATYSSKILHMMREEWKFNGLIMADDVGMNALQGNYADRVRMSLSAGCDFAIAALSVLKHGMAGTYFDQDNFEILNKAVLPTLNKRTTEFASQLKLSGEPPASDVTAARARLIELWADGPARLGYSLEL